ncbi:MAG: RTA1 domain-containing protein [Alistipes sp.]|nr:RTA1 domain-containing protein [Alistipes sp.]
MNKNKLWLGVILSAVVLGLAVVYLLRMWMPQNALNWVVYVAVALIAIRSVVRIAALAKVAGEKNDQNKG